MRRNVVESRSTDDELAELRGKLEAQEARLKRLERALFRDDEHEALLIAIAHAAADRAFSANELIQHSERVDPELVAALARAGLRGNARKLGRMLRRAEKTRTTTTGAGLRIHCIGADRDGLIWRISREF